MKKTPLQFFARTLLILALAVGAGRVSAAAVGKDGLVLPFCFLSVGLVLQAALANAVGEIAQAQAERIRSLEQALSTPRPDAVA